MPLLTVTDLSTYFNTRSGVYRAVDNVSFSLERGETLGIVGESGSGKSVTCYSLMGLVPQPPGRIESGTALFDGIDLLHCTPAQARGIRGKRVAMIFQDPMTSLNPYLRISEQLIEPLLIHEKVSKTAALKRALETLELVGINDAARRIHLYPHEFSGGMRQRVMIAMALITKPELLIADEPTTALDVTVQAQILDLIKSMQREFGMAVIFITHDLAVVSGLCDRVQVMYAGRIVETADEMSVVGVSFYRGVVLAASALSAAVQRSNSNALPGVGQLFHPVPAVHGVPVEAQDGRAGGRLAFWPDVFGVDPRAACTSEPQVEAVGVWGVDGLGANQLRCGVGRVEFPERLDPVGVKVGRRGSQAAVNFEFF